MNKLMIQSRYLLLLHSLIFFIPVNIYVIGDWLGCGVQWTLLRYQQTIFGNSIIPVTKEFFYVIGGTIQGSSALSLIIWEAGLVLLIVSFIIGLIAQFRFSDRTIRTAGILIVIGGLLLGLAGMLQYGLFFHGPSGSSIPVGPPIILIIGFFLGSERFRDRIVRYTGHDKNGTFQGYSDTETDTSPQIIYVSEILSLIVVALVILQIVFLFTITLNLEPVHFDTLLYQYYGYLQFEGKIPYSDYLVVYPPLFFIPVYCAMILASFSLDYSRFYTAFVIIMITLNIVTLVLLYQVTRKLFDQKRAFLSCVLFATAFSSAYFTFITYDIFPTFLLVCSFYLFVHHREFPGWIVATFGGLAKWFPFLIIPLYWVYQQKNKPDRYHNIKEIIFCAGIISLVTIPFLVLNSDMFLTTYSFHFNRPPQVISMIYYLDTISSQIFQHGFFHQVSLLLFLICGLSLFFWYYFRGTKDYLTLLYVIFLMIFTFVLTNKVLSPQYIVWLTPFLALLLSNSLREIVLFYLIQLVFFLELPLLFDILYRPDSTYSVIENSHLSGCFVFFTFKYLILLIAFYIIAANLRKHQLCQND